MNKCKPLIDGRALRISVGVQLASDVSQKAKVEVGPVR